MIVQFSGLVKKLQNLKGKNHSLECNAKIQSPLISIIIPTYNYGCYLADAIQSALKQTYPKIEIIVVDDGSTDNTKDIAKQYPVQYFFQKNQGVAIALNNGINWSHGVFFVCLAADDKLLPEYVKKTTEQMMKDPRIGFVYTGSTAWNEEIKDEKILMPRKIHNKYTLLTGVFIGALGTVLIRSKAFDSLGQGYDASLPAYEPLDLCFRICRQGWKARAVFEPLHWYRIHRDSRCPKTSQSREYHLSFLDRKFWFRKVYVRLYALYELSLGKIASLMSHPIGYLRGIKKKIRVKVWVGTHHWNDPINQEKAFELVQEINEGVDMLVRWSNDKRLRNHYEDRLRVLEFRLQKILSKDEYAKNMFTQT